jgi:hypothetical protein
MRRRETARPPFTGRSAAPVNDTSHHPCPSATPYATEAKQLRSGRGAATLPLAPRLRRERRCHPAPQRMSACLTPLRGAGGSSRPGGRSSNLQKAWPSNAASWKRWPALQISCLLAGPQQLSAIGDQVIRKRIDVSRSACRARRSSTDSLGFSGGGMPVRMRRLGLTRPGRRIRLAGSGPGAKGLVHHQ